MSNYTVTYLGHSAWLIETEGHYLLFDLQDGNAKTGGAPEDGFIDFDKLGDKPVFVFYSHRHYDHYSPALHRESLNRPNVLNVLGDFKAPFDAGNNTVTLAPRVRRELATPDGAGRCTADTAASTDAGVCMLVQADGLTFFFAGDHADWGDGDPNNAIYRREIDYLAGLVQGVEAAFIPVCTSGGQRPKALTEGAFYAVGALKPRVVFPMHNFGRDGFYDAFKKDFAAAGKTAEIICINQTGGRYEND